MKNWIPALSALLICGAFAQVDRPCNDRINSSTPLSRFTDHGDGTVTDNRTGLMWQRCIAGYEFSDNGTPSVLTDDSCTASARRTTFTWRRALQAAADRNAQGGYAGFTDWRLPNVKELYSIVETQCAGPAINLTIFPDTPSAPEFFTSSPASVGTPTTSVWVVDFAVGSDHSALVTSFTGRPPAKLVRLVR